MHPSLLALYFSLLILLIIVFVYFRKERISLLENKIYSLLLINGLVGVIIDILGINAHLNLPTTSYFRWMIVKLYFSYLFTFTFLHTLYLFFSIDNIKKISKKNMYVLLLMFLIGNLISFFLNFNYYNKGNSVYVYGSNSIYIYSLLFINLTIWIFKLLNNIKKLDSTKYIPILMIFIVGIPCVFVQLFNPNLLIVTLACTFIVILMYFTIENPDVKLLTVAEENRKLALKGFEEKSNLLFQISQEVKKPISNIEKLSKNIMDGTNKKDTILYVNKINLESRNLSSLVNNVLDLSLMDLNKLKVVNNKYNPYNLFKEIEITYNGNDDVKINYNISCLLNESLYFDSIKLKQIISSILYYEISNTKKGNINIHVDSINKYDICRMIINISNTGYNIELNKINDILNVDELNENEEDIDKPILDIKLVYKIIKILGGNMIIKSDNSIGNEFYIILDQKIDKDNFIEIDNSNNKIILVDDKISSINKFKKYLYKYDVTISMYGLDLINRIKHGEKYKLILLDDEMEPLNGYTIMKELK